MSATALCTLERISTPTWTVPKFHSVLFLKNFLPADISTRLLADLEIEKGAFRLLRSGLLTQTPIHPQRTSFRRALEL